MKDAVKLVRVMGNSLPANEMGLSLTSLPAWFMQMSYMLSDIAIINQIPSLLASTVVLHAGRIMYGDYSARRLSMT